jgi:hypothetical protein
MIISGVEDSEVSVTVAEDLRSNTPAGLELEYDTQRALCPKERPQHLLPTQIEPIDRVLLPEQV